MRLETEFKFKHGDIVYHKADDGQSMRLTVLLLHANICQAGTVQREYDCRISWVDKYSWRKKALGLQPTNQDIKRFLEVELVPYDPEKDPKEDE